MTHKAHACHLCTQLLICIIVPHKWRTVLHCAELLGCIAYTQHIDLCGLLLADAHSDSVVCMLSAWFSYTKTAEGKVIQFGVETCVVPTNHLRTSAHRDCLLHFRVTPYC